MVAKIKRMLLIAWFLMIFASLAFWAEPLMIILWYVKAIFTFLATLLQGGSATFFVAGHIDFLYGTIFALGLVAIPILILIIELTIRITKNRQEPLS